MVGVICGPSVAVRFFMLPHRVLIGLRDSSFNLRDDDKTPTDCEKRASVQRLPTFRA